SDRISQVSDGKSTKTESLSKWAGRFGAVFVVTGPGVVGSPENHVQYDDARHYPRRDGNGVIWFLAYKDEANGALFTPSKGISPVQSVSLADGSRRTISKSVDVTIGVYPVSCNDPGSIVGQRRCLLALWDLATKGSSIAIIDGTCVFHSDTDTEDTAAISHCECLAICHDYDRPDLSSIGVEVQPTCDTISGPIQVIPPDNIVNRVEELLDRFCAQGWRPLVRCPSEDLRVMLRRLLPDELRDTPSQKYCFTVDLSAFDKSKTDRCRSYARGMYNRLQAADKDAYTADDAHLKAITDLSPPIPVFMIGGSSKSSSTVKKHRLVLDCRSINKRLPSSSSENPSGHLILNSIRWTSPVAVSSVDAQQAFYRLCVCGLTLLLMSALGSYISWHICFCLSPGTSSLQSSLGALFFLVTCLYRAGFWSLYVDDGILAGAVQALIYNLTILIYCMLLCGFAVQPTKFACTCEPSRTEELRQALVPFGVEPSDSLSLLRTTIGYTPGTLLAAYDFFIKWMQQLSTASIADCSHATACASDEALPNLTLVTDASRSGGGFLVLRGSVEGGSENDLAGLPMLCGDDFRRNKTQRNYHSNRRELLALVVGLRACADLVNHYFDNSKESSANTPRRRPKVCVLSDNKAVIHWSREDAPALFNSGQALEKRALTRLVLVAMDELKALKRHADVETSPCLVERIARGCYDYSTVLDRIRGMRFVIRLLRNNASGADLRNVEYAAINGDADKKALVYSAQLHDDFCTTTRSAPQSCGPYVLSRDDSSDMPLVLFRSDCGQAEPGRLREKVLKDAHSRTEHQTVRPTLAAVVDYHLPGGTRQCRDLLSTCIIFAEGKEDHWSSLPSVRSDAAALAHLPPYWHVAVDFLAVGDHVKLFSAVCMFTRHITLFRARSETSAEAVRLLRLLKVKTGAVRIVTCDRAAYFRSSEGFLRRVETEIGAEVRLASSRAPWGICSESHHAIILDRLRCMLRHSSGKWPSDRDEEDFLLERLMSIVIARPLGNFLISQGSAEIVTPDSLYFGRTRDAGSCLIGTQPTSTSHQHLMPNRLKVFRNVFLDFVWSELKKQSLSAIASKCRGKQTTVVGFYPGDAVLVSMSGRKCGMSFRMGHVVKVLSPRRVQVRFPGGLLTHENAYNLVVLRPFPRLDPDIPTVSREGQRLRISGADGRWGEGLVTFDPCDPTNDKLWIQFDNGDAPEFLSLSMQQWDSVEKGNYEAKDCARESSHGGRDETEDSLIDEQMPSRSPDWDQTVVGGEGKVLIHGPVPEPPDGHSLCLISAVGSGGKASETSLFALEDADDLSPTGNDKLLLDAVPSDQEVIYIQFSSPPALCDDLLRTLTGRSWVPMRYCPHWLARLRALERDEPRDDPEQRYVFELTSDNLAEKRPLSLPDSAIRFSKTAYERLDATQQKAFDDIVKDYEDRGWWVPTDEGRLRATAERVLDPAVDD
ncbi:hypothetical protein FOL47_000175, partial [Perkinsus chesapeaki]